MSKLFFCKTTDFARFALSLNRDEHFCLSAMLGTQNEFELRIEMLTLVNVFETKVSKNIIVYSFIAIYVFVRKLLSSRSSFCCILQ